MTKLLYSLLLLLPLVVVASALGEEGRHVREPYFGIRVIDEQTSRGVPLAELRTVNDITLVTDSAGWAAFDEPGLMNGEVFFHVSSPGYDFSADGFGVRGVRLKPSPGATATIKLKRKNIAERIVRVTGQGIFRDSELLGSDTPKGIPSINAGVVGQDSVQVVIYKDRLFWLWGDTNLANYPLGNFKTTCATSPLPGPDTFHPAAGVPLTYFTNDDRPDRVRAMAPMKQPGVVWLFGLLNIDNPDGRPTLLAHYSRRESLEKELEHGLMRFDDEAGVFQKIKSLGRKETWRFPRNNAVRVREGEADFFYFTGPLPTTRVQAKWEHLVDPSDYEALVFDEAAGEYRWQREHAPTTQDDESALIEAGKLPKRLARYQLTDVESGKVIRIHGASVEWNAVRKRWILIGVQIRGKESFLGEVWYAEAEHPSGPWGKAVKIATHPQYSFYNPRQHAFFAENGGRTIYFEGTYTRMFSGNPTPTPRYDYNQLMYRLDMTDERLEAVR